MNMTKKLIFTLLATTLLTSCGNEDAELSNTRTRVNLETGINAISRAPHINSDGSGNFENGDIIGLAISGNNGEFTTIEFSYNNPLYWEDIKLIDKPSTIGLVGFYPLLTIEKDKNSISFDIENESEKDLLLAPKQEIAYLSQNKIMLGFNHAMHKLNISFKSSDGSYSKESLGLISTTCHAYSACTVDLKEGIVNTPANKKDYQSVVGKNISLLIIPQNKNDVTLKLNIAGNQKDFSLSGVEIKNTDRDYLEGGKTLSIELDIRKNGIFVGGANISGWENQGSVSGDIIVD